ncbi:MAG: hypothetical protein WC979_03285 [Candidatus Pacearchaeota archaeon]|jgi:hypothetical protein|nr:hypothetical protein [Clostridia bacterium]
MITNKDGQEIRLITIADLCRFCMNNGHDSHKIVWDDTIAIPRRRGYVGTCANKAPGCDGFTHAETCPIWTSLQNVICLNV